MKLYAILPAFLFSFMLTACLNGNDKDETVMPNGQVIGTLFTDASNNIYVVSDTVTGGDDEITFFIRNSGNLNFKDSTRFYIEFNNIAEINDTSYWVDYVDYKVIPVRNIVNVDTNTPDTLAKDDNFSIKKASISHDCLNIQYYFLYNKLEEHYFYFTKNKLNQPAKDTVEIIFHHKSLEKPPFYNEVKTFEQIKYVISIPIAELQTIYPLQDSVFIRILPQHDEITSKSMTVLYSYGNAKNIVSE
ncbi:MAG: hypothetical protein LBV41_06810 [Cytophagaceae bacterium]|jgi:hypothetical protein|nr:hypothetical protein [Cytophagaceae bacterium]